MPKFSLKTSKVEKSPDQEKGAKSILYCVTKR
jgi:hypothetical protein